MDRKLDSDLDHGILFSVVNARKKVNYSLVSAAAA